MLQSSEVGRSHLGNPGLIPTGTFTPAAVKEAIRDEAPPIDLVDRAQLTEKLEELGLGARRKMVERVTADEDWFKNL